MKLIINGIVKNFQSLKDGKSKIKLTRLDLRGNKPIKLFS